jgi:hypothetical protein
MSVCPSCGRVDISKMSSHLLYLISFFLFFFLDKILKGGLQDITCTLPGCLSPVYM